MPVRMALMTAAFVGADVNAYAGAGDDVILGVNMVASELLLNRPGLRIDYLIHDEEGQLDQLNFCGTVIDLNKTN